MSESEATQAEASAWETVIGLEIHAQLATKSKIFSASAIAYGAPPNAQANLVDLGYPGVLPVLNAEAVRMAVKFGLAIGARIAPQSVFARKNFTSSTCTGRLRRSRPTMRGTRFVRPLRPGTAAGFSRSMPSRAVANRFE